jgi:anaerobic selenocysteine-containing dehydrogenase
MTRRSHPAGWPLDRRRFLKLSSLAAAAAASGGLPLFHLREEAVASDLGGASAARSPAKLGTWEDLYRQRWSWDRVAKGTHGWLNCRSACNFDLYVKDGVVVREEQTSESASAVEGSGSRSPGTRPCARSPSSWSTSPRRTAATASSTTSGLTSTTAPPRPVGRASSP